MSSTDVNVAVPEVLYLRTIADGQVTEGEVLYEVAAVWSNSSGNITIQVISDDFTTDPSPIIVPAPGLVTPTNVSITSKEDVVAQGDRIVTVKIQVSSSTGTTTEASFPVTITDDDTAGVSVTESSGNTAVSEGGATDNYSVVLTSQPTANVTVNLNGGAQLNLSATALTFTPQNWNVAQVVTVTAVNDAVVEGNHTQTISHTAISTDARYNGISIRSVNANITDNDRNDPPSFTAGPNQTVAEDSGPGFFPHWATNIFPGPADEASQIVNFQVTNNNNELFSVQPAIDSAGNLTYTPAANANGSATVTVSLQDDGGTANGGVDTSAPQTFTITITPINDTATISGIATSAITEDLNVVNGNLSASGNLSVSDADTSEAKFNTTVTSAAANLGSLRITETGNFTYTVANSAVQYLGALQTKTETFSVQSVDGTASQDITITINGSNDTATITGTATAAVTEDTSTPNLTAIGSLTVADADTSEAKFNTTVISADNIGSLSITETGNFTYTVANTAVQYLGKGETKAETFSVKSVDGTASQDITITINGVNDIATITGTTTTTVTEDASTPNLTATGTLIVADADTGEAKFNTTVISAAANKGSLSITETGDFTYTVANSAVQYLGALQTKTETFSVQSVDGTASQDITITINGSNDTATIIGTTTAGVTEDSSTPKLTATGTLTVADADTGEAKFNTTVISAAANKGSLSITETGDFTYTVANTAVQYLGKGETKAETFTVKSVDGTASQDITITINGVNDIATITGTTTTTVTEDASTPNLTATGTLIVADADTGEAKFNTTVISAAANKGSLSITETGDFTYTVANSAVQYLGKGETKAETFTVKSVDGTASQDITITINGSNDAPTDLILSKSDIDEESAALSTIGLFSTTDTDVSDRFTYSLVDGDGANDNDAFIVDGNQLKIKASPNFEIKQSYKIRVNTTDAGLSYQKALTISVNDLDIPTRLTTKDDDIFNITGDDTKVTLQVALSGHNSHQVNELGVFIVDDATGRINGIAPDAVGYAQAALERAQVFFSALTNIPNGFDTSNLTRLVELNSGANLRFYLVKNNSTTDGILAGINSITEVLFSNSATQKVTNLGNNQFSLAWEDGSGTNNNDFQDLVVKIQSSNQSLPLGAKLQGKPQGELIDLRGVKTPVKANFILNREAAFDNFVGFYQLTDENGGIDTNGDGNADILPGQSGYTQAAVRGRVAGIDLTVSNQATATFTGSFTDGGIFAPFMIANGRPDAILDGNSHNDPAVYFPFLGANPDKADHIRLLGDNIFSFEDLQNSGDKDFNDMIVQFKLSS